MGFKSDIEYKDAFHGVGVLILRRVKTDTRTMVSNFGYDTESVGNLYPAGGHKKCRVKYDTFPEKRRYVLESFQRRHQ